MCGLSLGKSTAFANVPYLYALCFTLNIQKAVVKKDANMKKLWQMMTFTDCSGLELMGSKSSPTAINNLIVDFSVWRSRQDLLPGHMLAFFV